MSVLLACVQVQSVCVLDVHRGRKRRSDPLKLELEMELGFSGSLKPQINQPWTGNTSTVSQNKPFLLDVCL